jgi:hypothetical protein
MHSSQALSTLVTGVLINLLLSHFINTCTSVLAAPILTLACPLLAEHPAPQYVIFTVIDTIREVEVLSILKIYVGILMRFCEVCKK